MRIKTLDRVVQLLNGVVHRSGKWIVSTDLQSIDIDLALERLLGSMLVFLPRKEVIHPHVPVRIPCYDLTPIISPTLGPGKLARQVLATFMV